MQREGDKVRKAQQHGQEERGAGGEDKSSGAEGRGRRGETLGRNLYKHNNPWAVTLCIEPGKLAPFAEVNLISPRNPPALTNFQM